MGGRRRPVHARHIIYTTTATRHSCGESIQLRGGDRAGERIPSSPQIEALPALPPSTAGVARKSSARRHLGASSPHILESASLWRCKISEAHGLIVAIRHLRVTARVPRASSEIGASTPLTGYASTRPSLMRLRPRSIITHLAFCICNTHSCEALASTSRSSRSPRHY
jgi:hypothetical protein